MNPQSAAIAVSGNPLNIALNPKPGQKIQNPPIGWPIHPALYKITQKERARWQTSQSVTGVKRIK